jgi:hypothetical protein
MAHFLKLFPSHKSDSEIYLFMVNSKMQDYTQADYVLEAWEFGSGLFVLHCA